VTFGGADTKGYKGDIYKYTVNTASWTLPASTVYLNGKDIKSSTINLALLDSTQQSILIAQNEFT